jgi:hypothetical protein
MPHATGFLRCHPAPLPGKCLRRIPQAAVMVINVPCAPMAYETQLLAYQLDRKPIVFFYQMNASDLGDIGKECSIFNVKT